VARDTTGLLLPASECPAGDRGRDRDNLGERMGDRGRDRGNLENNLENNLGERMGGRMRIGKRDFQCSTARQGAPFPALSLSPPPLPAGSRPYHRAVSSPDQKECGHLGPTGRMGGNIKTAPGCPLSGEGEGSDEEEWLLRKPGPTNRFLCLLCRPWNSGVLAWPPREDYRIYAAYLQRTGVPRVKLQPRSLLNARVGTQGDDGPG
jgi:hypothetical protein